MFKQTITRVRPNKTVKWHFESETPENIAIDMSINAIQLAAGITVDTEGYTSTQTVSANELTLTIVRTSPTREWLDEVQAAFANPDHLLYSRTQYYISNGVTETWVTEEVTA
jgi:hypothetical protein